jgi:hypothetical protein
MSSEGVALAMAIPFLVAGGVMITAALCFYARTTRERIGERKGERVGPTNSWNLRRSEKGFEG